MFLLLFFKEKPRNPGEKPELSTAPQPLQVLIILFFSFLNASSFVSFRKTLYANAIKRIMCDEMPSLILSKDVYAHFVLSPQKTAITISQGGPITHL